MKTILKNNWLKAVLVILSYIAIWVGFDIIMGSVVVNQLSSFLFSICYIIIIVLIVLLLPKKASIPIYIISFLLMFIISIAQYFHYQALGYFFGTTDLSNAGEGAAFLSFLDGSIGKRIILYIIGGLILFILTIIVMIKTKKNEKNKKWLIIKIIIAVILVIISIVLHIFAVKSLGDYEKDTYWLTNDSKRNIYEKFIDRNSCINLTGIYEFVGRDIYLYILNNFSPDIQNKVKDIDEYFEENPRSNEDNEYTGIFKDNNLILVLLESLDSWLVDEETTPTLTYMMETGWNFTNRYAPGFGGGRTLNSEFAASTGLYIPISGYNIYSSYNNNYSISLPNLFKDAGYTANSLHFNRGSYYSRSNLHQAIGYEHYYSLLDLNIGGSLKDQYNDETLAANDDVYELLVPKDEKFMTYVITMSPHGPYEDNQLCDDDADKLECIKTLVNMTDNFLKVLLERLEEDGILDETTIVLFTDHYAYGYDDEEVIAELKNIDDPNEIDKTPFVIWNSQIESEEIDTILDTADILPTLANLFDLDWDANNYLGTDVFSESHEDFVYFKDGSYISSDGKDYSKQVAQKLQINDDILITDYYNTK